MPALRSVSRSGIPFEQLEVTEQLCWRYAAKWDIGKQQLICLKINATDVLQLLYIQNVICLLLFQLIYISIFQFIQGFSGFFQFFQGILIWFWIFDPFWVVLQLEEAEQDECLLQMCCCWQCQVKSIGHMTKGINQGSNNVCWWHPLLHIATCLADD